MVNKIHTTIWLSLLSLLLASIWPEAVKAQVTIQTAAIESSLISPRTFFHVTLFNTGSSCEVNLEGDLFTRSGEPVLSFKTEPFRMPSGGRTAMASEFRMQVFSYGTGPMGRAAQRFQRLPGGEYRYCIRLHSSLAESHDEYCDEISVEELLILDLVQPWDGDTIDETRPALTWMMTGSGPTLDMADIRMVLVPMQTGQSPEQALAAERPLFMVPHVKQRTLPYPSGVTDLERGRCYSWQVERLDGSRVVDRSEPWGFCILEHVEPVQNKYVRIDRVEPGAIYEATDRKIFFRYDEPYASERVDCSIMDVEGTRVEPQLLDDARQDALLGARSVGVNLYELDLQPYGLKPGYYDLVVRNEKGRARTLKFHVPR